MLIDSLAITRILSVFGLFIITAIAEILGCYFPYLILKEGKSAWLWLPTVLSLAIFVWLLTLHPAASGRIYAAYGGIYLKRENKKFFSKKRLVKLINNAYFRFKEHFLIFEIKMLNQSVNTNAYYYFWQFR